MSAAPLEVDVVEAAGLDVADAAGAWNVPVWLPSVSSKRPGVGSNGTHP